MAFDWTAYLDLAHELAAQSSGPPLEEARLRSAISRAYYAAFKTAFNFLCGRNPAVRFRREDAHRYVFERFAYNPDADWQDVGSLLDRLRRLRNRADYEDQMDDLASNTRSALEYAADIIAAVARLP